MLSAMTTEMQWLATAQGLNGVFALLCLCGALGADARGVLGVSAMLYAAFMFV